MGQTPVVLVTGAAGAIGDAAVRRFLAAGMNVAGIDRFAGHPAAREPGYVEIVADLENDDEVAAAMKTAVAHGPLRHVVGIAGGALPDEPPGANDPGAIDPELFRASVDANLVTQYRVLHSALPRLRAADGDRSITLTSSFNALAGYGMPAYSAAKAGLIGMMHALTTPLGREGIRINVVAPGTVRTPRTERIWSHVPDHFERLAETAALGRLGTPDDVARSFIALALQLTHVTGQVLVVDGGQMVRRG